MRLTNGLAKNRRTEFFISFCFAILLWFRPTDQNLADKRSINIGTLIYLWFRLTGFKYRFFAKPFPLQAI